MEAVLPRRLEGTNEIAAAFDRFLLVPLSLCGDKPFGLAVGEGIDWYWAVEEFRGSIFPLRERRDIRSCECGGTLR